MTMVKVEILAPADVGEDYGRRVVATLTVDGDQYTVEGDDSVFDFSEPLFGVTRRRLVKFGSDREEWARSLPEAMRSPYLSARVVSDSKTLATPSAGDEDAQAEEGSSIVDAVADAVAHFYVGLRRRRQRLRSLPTHASVRR